MRCRCKSKNGGEDGDEGERARPACWWPFARSSGCAPKRGGAHFNFWKVERKICEDGFSARHRKRHARGVCSPKRHSGVMGSDFLVILRPRALCVSWFLKINAAAFPNPSRRWSRRRPSASGVPWSAFHPRRSRGWPLRRSRDIRARRCRSRCIAPDPCKAGGA